MGSQWYYARNNRKSGPVSSAELRRLVAAGQLQPTDMVLKKGHQKWIPACAVKGLFVDDTAELVQPVEPVVVQPSNPADVINAKVNSAVQGFSKWISAKAHALGKALSTPAASAASSAGEVRNHASPNRPPSGVQTGRPLDCPSRSQQAMSTADVT